MQNGGLATTMLGPSKVSGCPQQKHAARTTPRGGSNSGKASAAQPESGPHRDRSPTTAPPANRASKNTFSSVTISFLIQPFRIDLGYEIRQGKPWRANSPWVRSTIRVV